MARVVLWKRLVLAKLALLALCGAATVACNRRIQPQKHGAPPSAAVFPVNLRVPAKLTSIETGSTTAAAQEMRVACKTCHSLREPKPLPSSSAELKEFHVGLTVRHGSLTCGSCHDPAAPSERLHLASGEILPMTSVLALCSQCHGPQRRDYDRGMHGGMTGYWDLSRGPRTRNLCVDCHDPHAPAFVGGMPLPPPRDRIPPARTAGPEGASHD